MRRVTALIGTLCFVTACGSTPDAAERSSESAGAASTRVAPPSVVPAATVPTRSGPAPTGGPGRAPEGQPDRTLPECTNPRPFDHVPLAEGTYMSYRPLGFVSYPTHVVPTKHAAFTINLPGESRTAAVTAPGHVWVTHIVKVSPPDGPPGYQVRLQPCRDVIAYFNHLGSLAAPVLEAFESGRPECETNTFNQDVMTKCRLATRVELASGEPVGVSDGYAGVDFGAIDFAAEETRFADNSEYDYEYVHTIPPTDLFDSAALAEITPHIGSIDGTRNRSAPPIGGSHNHDVAGTAQGSWFPLDGSMRTVQNERQFIAFVHDFVEPAQPVFSFGGGVAGIAGGLAQFVPRATGTVNRDFDAVGPDGRVYCWENFLTGVTPSGINTTRVDGVVLVVMPDASTLRIERAGSVGATCANVDQALTGAASTFAR
ncbi:MAG: hypothetical protein ACT4OX_14045 [Actinomycetota bacterium]